VSAEPLWTRLLPAGIAQLLARRAVLRRLIGNAGWLVADKIVRLGVGLFVTVMVARYLGPANFGLFSYAQSIVVLTSAFAVLGLSDIVVRDLVRMPDREAEITASALSLRLAGAAVAVSLCALSIVLLRPFDRQALIVTLVLGSVVFPQAMDVIDYRFQSITNVRAIVLLRNLSFLLFSVLKIAAIALHASLLTFAALTSLEIVVVALLQYLYARRLGFSVDLRSATLGECRRLWLESWPLMARTLAIAVYMRADQIIIGGVFGDRQVGMYAAAVRIPDIWYFLPTAVMTSFVPVLARSFVQSRELYERQLLSVMRPLVWLSIAVAAALSVLATPIIGLLYGARFAGAADVLRVYAWAGVFGTLGLTTSAWLINSGLMRYGLFQAVVGLVVSVSLNLLVIPRFGIVGAAWVYVVAQFLSAFALNLVFPATRPIFLAQLRALGMRG
jgi:PST family polysaccharide transporter